MERMFSAFEKRSDKLERIDTGDYTPGEYERFLVEIRLVNRFAGDLRALRRSLLRRIRGDGLKEFSVLDVGAGSGEVLRTIARFARRRGLRAQLTALELHEQSVNVIREASSEFPEIEAVRGDAFRLPFADGSFDYAVCSLFTHHFPDDQVVEILREMSRVSARGIFVIDLHRHPMALILYRLFCFGFRISPLVVEDGSLSILRSFRPRELEILASRAGLEGFSVKRSFPFRNILESQRK